MRIYLKNIGADFPSAIVVFLVAIPLCLGIAVASGLSEFSGIIAGVIGGVVVGLISKSSLSVSGPAAGLTAIVAAAVLKLPAANVFFLAVVLAGVFQLIMGVLKLGVLGDYVPNSVIKGMLAAIGIILIMKQIPHLVGYDKDYEGDETFIQLSGENTFSAAINSLNHLTPMAVFIGLCGLAILILYETAWVKKRKFFQYMSGPLLVVLVGILINNTLGEAETILAVKSAHLVNIPTADSSEEFLTFFSFPSWKSISNVEVWVIAITLALVASLETLLSIEAIDKLDPNKRVTPPNRELIAQGIGNIASGLIGGLPVTSVIVRSSANVNAGAKTKASAIIHGLLLLSCVAFIPDILNLIPKAALAAILVFTGYKLAKLTLFKEYYAKGWDQFVPFLVTIAAIVFTDLLKGVMVGMGVGLFYVIRNNFRTAVLCVNHENNYLIRLRKDVSFFIKPILKQKLEKIPDNANLILDLTNAEYLDKDVIDTINEFSQHTSLKNIRFMIKKNDHNPLHRLVLVN